MTAQDADHFVHAVTRLLWLAFAVWVVSMIIEVVNKVLVL